MLVEPCGMNSLLKCKKLLLTIDTNEDKNIYEDFENSILNKNKHGKIDNTKITYIAN